MEQSLHTEAAECERRQQKIRELELELARTSTHRTTTNTLQEDLQAERAQLIAADKKVSAIISSESNLGLFSFFSQIGGNLVTSGATRGISC